MDKKVGIIIPCYNAELYIGQCIDSIVNQTLGFEWIELIIIDDASIDFSLDIILKYREMYPDNIVVEQLKVNRGQANARNIGLYKSSAPYLIFVDADDWLEESACEIMLRKAEEYNCEVIGCGYMEHRNEDVKHVAIVQEEKYFRVHSVEERKLFVKGGNFGGVIGRSCFAADFLKKNNIKFKEFAKYEDNYFSGVAVYKVHSYYALPEELYHYRILAESNSRSRNDMNHFARLNVELEKLVYYQENGLFYMYYDEIREAFMNGFYLNTLHIIFCLFDYIPIDIIHTLQCSVREIYPDYVEYCRGSKDAKDYFILTVAFDFPVREWEKIKNAYLQNLLYGNSDEVVLYLKGMMSTLGLSEEIM